jgi:hypothetical protein
MRRQKYLCLDDDTESVADLVELLSCSCPDLVIDSKPPQPFDGQIQDIATRARASELTGLILDLRLDELKTADLPLARYNAPAIAQEMRTLMTQRRVPPFPIVLWSIDEKMARSYKPDLTSHDLFDSYIDKPEVPNTPEKYASELISLSIGYRQVTAAIKKRFSFHKLLRVPDKHIDPRVGEQFTAATGSLPTHTYALYILRQLIRRSGPLIDLPTVCARLGVAVTSPAINRLFGRLSKSVSYKGPFSDAWPRWWAHAIEDWWQKITGETQALASQTAAERVAKLRRALRISNGLTIAPPIDDNYSSYFTTLCAVTQKPLDPIDGFTVADPGAQPWHDKRYVSRQVALDPAAFDKKVTIDPLDEARLKALRSQIKAHEKKGG